jgi:hypothetical protein
MEPANWDTAADRNDRSLRCVHRQVTSQACEVAMKRIFISAAVASAAMLTAAQAQTFGTATTDLNVRSGPDPQFPVIGMIRENRRATVLGCIEGSRWCQVDTGGQTGWAYSQYLRLTGDIAMTLPAPEIEVNVAARPALAAPPPVAAYPAPGPVVAYDAPAPVYAAPAPVVSYRAPGPVLAYPAPAPAPTYAAPPPPVVAYRASPPPAYPPAPAVTYSAPVTTTMVTTGVAARQTSGALIPPRETIYASTTLPPAYIPSRSVRTYLTANPLDAVYLSGNLDVGAGLPDGIDLWPVPNSRYRYTYVNDYPVLVDPTTRRIVYVSR